jgi:hypothetical protein
VKTFAPLDLPLVLRYEGDDYFNTRSSHNSYAQWLAETGLAGSIPFAALLGYLLVRGAGATARLARHGQLWVIGAYSGFIGMSTHLWVLSGITNTGTWLVYGLVGAIIVTDSWHQRAGRYHAVGSAHVGHEVRLPRRSWAGWSDGPPGADQRRSATAIRGTRGPVLSPGAAIGQRVPTTTSNPGERRR